MIFWFFFFFVALFPQLTQVAILRRHGTETINPGRELNFHPLFRFLHIQKFTCLIMYSFAVPNFKNNYFVLVCVCMYDFTHTIENSSINFLLWWCIKKTLKNVILGLFTIQVSFNHFLQLKKVSLFFYFFLLNN